MDKETLLIELDKCTEDLTKQIARFEINSFNQQPSETQWSAAQVAEHLLKLAMIANRALSGETIPTNRPADEKMALIKMVMEHDTKRTAPEIVHPSSEIHEPQKIVEQIKNQIEVLKQQVNNLDLTEACTGIKHPGFGTLTRLEWVYFTIQHSIRHTKQMQRIQETVMV